MFDTACPATENTNQSASSGVTHKREGLQFIEAAVYQYGEFEVDSVPNWDPM